MTGFEKQAVARESFVSSLEERGIPRDLALFCAKQAEYENIGRLAPFEYTRGFMDELEKVAAEGGIPSLFKDEKKDEESVWDKIKRWAIYTGIGAGGFALGNYWPEFRNYGKQSFEGIKKHYDDMTSPAGTKPGNTKTKPATQQTTADKKPAQTK